MKIWYQSTLDFSQHPNYAKALAEHFKKVASPGTEVALHGRSGGQGVKLDASDIIGSPIVYHSVVDPAFVESVLDAEAASADAFVAASFSEPILPELRSLARMPVVSMAEACFMAASTSAPKIGMVTLNAHIIPYVEKSISLHKWKERVSGVHLIAGDISETELDAQYSQPAPYLERLAAGVRNAIAAGAQAVIVARQALPTLDRSKYAPAAGAARGAYVITQGDAGDKSDIILIATGSELSIATDAAEVLLREGCKPRVVSMPSSDIFERQDQAYRDDVLPPSVSARVAIEQASEFGWDRYVGRGGRTVTMTKFGASAPINKLQERFGFTVDNVVAVCRSVMSATR